ncbi:MAG: TIGR02996 domain-containing protein [Gemmataceae bacterium]|nr:TIGR02996 domain-containing protein [Gemmataceae bacterium]
MATRDDHGLFAAILQDPEDDALRLVWADWLEENGDAARAEFIRLQVSGSDPRREAELLWLHKEEWLAFLAAEFRLVEESEFRRGLLWKLVMPGAADEDLIRLQSVPELECLDLRGSSVTDTGLEHLAALPNLRSLFVDRREQRQPLLRQEPDA